MTVTHDQAAWFAQTFSAMVGQLRQGGARQGARHPARADLPALRGAPAPRGLPRHRQDPAGPGDLRHGAGHELAHPVHPRPAAERRHRGDDLRPAPSRRSSSTAGPIFATIVLADEINRASPKTQSALLEVMEEGKVTVDGMPPRRRRAVHGHRHPEPHRAGRHLPPARGAARPLPHEDARSATPTTTRPSRVLRRRQDPRPRQGAAARGHLAARHLDMAELADEVHVDAAILDYVCRIAEETRRHPSASSSGCRCAAAWPSCAARRPGPQPGPRPTSCPTTSSCSPSRCSPTACCSPRRPQFAGTTVQQAIDQILAEVAPPTERLASDRPLDERVDDAPPDHAPAEVRRLDDGDDGDTVPAPSLHAGRRTRRAPGARPGASAPPARRGARIAGRRATRARHPATSAAGRDPDPHDHAAARAGADRAHPDRRAHPRAHRAAASGRSPSRPGRCGAPCSRCCAGCRRWAGPCWRRARCRGGSPPATGGSSCSWSPPPPSCSCSPAWPSRSAARGCASASTSSRRRVIVGDPATGRIEVTNDLPPRAAAAARRAARRRHGRALRAAAAGRRAHPRGALRRADPAPRRRARRPRHDGARRPARARAAHRGVDRAHRAVRAPLHRRAREPGRRAAARPRGRGDAGPVDERPRVPRPARVPARRRPPLRALALLGQARPAARAAVPRHPPLAPGGRRRHRRPRSTARGEDDVELAISCAASLAVRSILDEQDTTVVCHGQTASRTTAPLTLDALSRAEVGPVDVFGSAGEASALAPDASVAVLVTGGAPALHPAAAHPGPVRARGDQGRPRRRRRPAGGRAPRGRPRDAPRARAARPAPGAVLGGSPGDDAPRRPGSRPRCAAGRPAGPAGRARPTSPRAGAARSPTRDAWVDAAFAAALVTHRPGRDAHRLPRAAVDGRRRGRAGARARHRPPRGRLPVAGRRDPGRARGDLLPARRAGRRAHRPRRGVLPTAQTFSDLATWAVLGWKRWLTLLPPVDARGAGARAALAGRAARRRRHPRRGAALGVGAAHRRGAVAAARRLDRARHPRAGRGARAGRGLRRCARRLARRARATATARRCRTARAGRPGFATGALLVALAVLAGLRRRPAAARHRRGAERRVVRTALVPPTRRRRSSPARCPGFRQLHRAQHRRRSTTRSCSGWAGLPCGRARALRHPRRLRRARLGRGRPQHATASPFQQVGSRIAPRGDGTPVTSPSRSRRAGTAATGSRPSAHRPGSSSTGRAPTSSPPSCGSTPTPTRRWSRAACSAASATR